MGYQNEAEFSSGRLSAGEAEADHQYEAEVSGRSSVGSRTSIQLDSGRLPLPPSLLRFRSRTIARLESVTHLEVGQLHARCQCSTTREGAFFAAHGAVYTMLIEDTYGGIVIARTSRRFSHFRQLYRDTHAQLHLAPFTMRRRVLNTTSVQQEREAQLGPFLNHALDAA